VGAGDFTEGWLISRPDAFDVIDKLKADSKVDVCLSQVRGTSTADYQQAILTARAVMLGWRDRSVVDALETYVRNGVPGFLGVMVDPKVSEAYGNMLVAGNDESFESSLERLWSLLRSQRSEASANYRLAVQFGMAGVVVRGGSEPEMRRRYKAVMEKIKVWENDEAPHRRAAYVNTSKLMREAIDRKRLLLLRTQF
jgi:hypothetical protein